MERNMTASIPVSTWQPNGRLQMAASIPVSTTLKFTTHSAHSIYPLFLLHNSISLKELKQIQAFCMKTHLQNHGTLIKFCTLNPTPDSLTHASQLFDEMPHPDIIVFNQIARGYAHSNTPLKAMALFANALSIGISPDDYTFPSLLKACARLKALEEAKQLQCLVIKHGQTSNIYISPALVNMYAESNDMGAARLVFDRISEPCLVTYNAILTGYARNCKPNEVLALFRELQASNLNPSQVTMLSVLSSCGLVGALELGKWAHKYITKNGLNRCLKVQTSLVDMYAKCGSLDDAVMVFDEMTSRDTGAWSAMIMAYAIHGQAERAVSAFRDMKMSGLNPDEITFLGLLYACDHSGLVSQGWRILREMKEEHGISPGIKHYGCVVDMLGRVGRLNDAYWFLENLPIKPTPILWRTLLSSCNIHGNVELGKRVMSRILELDNSHIGDYVIFSNLCARAGEWDEVDEIRRKLKDKRLKKVPGCSSIEVKNEIHEFFSGGRAEYGSLHRAVDEVFEELKSVGYIPETSLVFHRGMEEDDEEKAKSLRYHSEKLAITFGIGNTAPGTTIRVVKNLRMCGDCHSAVKLMSVIFEREIMVRDVQRFHRFKNGKCSCGDYW